MANKDDIGVKIKLETAEFNKAITDINRNVRLINSGFKEVAAGLDNWSDSQEGVEARSKSLNGVIEQQGKKLSTLESQYKKVAAVKGENSKEAKNLQIRINNERAALNKNEKELRECEDALKQFAAGTHKASEQSKKLTSQVERLNTTAAKMNTFGSAINRYVTLPLLALGTASIKFASDMAETTNKVDVVFKNNATTINEWADDAIENMGLASQTAMDSAALFGDFGNGMGLSAKQTLEMSMSLVQLSADLASFKNVRQDVAQTALSGIYTGETESLKQLGVVMTEANLQQFAISEGITKNISDMTQAEKVMLRYAYVMGVTKDAQGDFARTSDGAANQFRILVENVKELSASLGEVLLPAVNKGVKSLNELVSNFNDMTPAGKKAIVTIAGFGAALGPVVKTTSSAVKGVGKLKDIFGKLKVARVAGELGTVGTSLAGIASAASTVVPVVGIFALTAGAAALGIKLLHDHMEETRQEFIDATVAAHVFGEEMEDTSSVEKFEQKIKDAKVSIDQLNKATNVTNKDIKFKVDSSAFDDAKQVVIDLRKEYALLLLAMDDGEGDVDILNSNYEELGESLKKTKESVVALQIAEAASSDYSPEKRAEMVRELNTEYDNYCTQVDETIKAITQLNDTTFTGKEVTGEMITAHDTAKQKLMELGATEEQVANVTMSLNEQNQFLNDGIAAGTSGCEGYNVSLSNYATMLGDKLTPAYAIITGAVNDYTAALGVAQGKHLPRINELKRQIALSEEGAATWDGLITKYKENPEAFWDYVNITSEGLVDLTKAQEDNYIMMQGLLSEEEKKALAQLDSAHGCVETMEGMVDAYNETGEELEGKLTIEEGLFTQAEADAFAEATGTVKTALNDFSVENGIPIEEAITGLQTALQETGIELDTNTAAMLTSLSTFGTTLVTEGTGIGQDTFDELVKPFQDAEEEGENLINDMIDGVTTQTDERIGEVRETGGKISDAVYDGAAEAAEIKSPSKRMKRIGGFMIAGLVEGLKENAYKAYDAAAEIAGKVNTTLTDAWGIASPSKVTAKMGGFYVKGLELGFLENLQSSADVISRGLKAQTRRIQAESAMGYGTPAINHYNNQRTQTFSPTINVHGGMDSFQYRQETKRLMREQAALVAQG